MICSIKKALRPWDPKTPLKVVYIDGTLLVVTDYIRAEVKGKPPTARDRLLTQFAWPDRHPQSSKRKASPRRVADAGDDTVTVRNATSLLVPVAHHNLRKYDVRAVPHTYALVLPVLEYLENNPIALWQAIEVRGIPAEEDDGDETEEGKKRREARAKKLIYRYRPVAPFGQVGPGREREYLREPFLMDSYVEQFRFNPRSDAVPAASFYPARAYDPLWRSPVEDAPSVFSLFSARPKKMKPRRPGELAAIYEKHGYRSEDSRSTPAQSSGGTFIDRQKDGSGLVVPDAGEITDLLIADEEKKAEAADATPMLGEESETEWEAAPEFAQFWEEPELEEEDEPAKPKKQPPQKAIALGSVPQWCTSYRPEKVMDQNVKTYKEIKVWRLRAGRNIALGTATELERLRADEDKAVAEWLRSREKLPLAAD